MLGEKKVLSGFGTESRTQVNGGGSSGRGTKDRSHRAEESKCYPENTGEVAGEEVGPVWGLMLEKMPFSASQAGRRPPAFRSPGAQAPRRARKRTEGGASSNVFSMFDQSQIQEFKEAFTIMDQNRDGFIDKEDLRDTFAALGISLSSPGRINVKNEELEAMVKEAPGPINFTVFLTMFGEKLKGTDPEETILHAFKVFDTEGKGFIKADFIKEKLMTQADRFSEEEIKQMFAAFPPDVCGNLDYRNLCYVITHGEEKD
ncbi:myosin regulatory light chain 10 isoform X1 [Myotis daubentonii]|uniref:myosin regulatory light chain 10 isoform X1 n=1 Tax=Myotis daubentonii TaxID=98922 RepID=UPI0028731D43|nr:myosin regulatory light chain 10 isoform X1 [Myotis daubentonii]